MPYKPDVPCADCGKLGWRGRGTLPQGQYRCLACRRSNPPQRQAKRRPRRPDRNCANSSCNNVFTPRQAAHYYCCRRCSNRGSDHSRLCSTERGYGTQHNRAREQAHRDFIDGQPCARCGDPLHTGDAMDLDHTDDRTGYLGLSHAACNRSASSKPRQVRRIPKVCDCCGIGYLTRWPDQRYCTDHCRVMARRQHKPRPVKPVKVSHPCPTCSTPTTRIKYCSTACSTEAGRTEMRNRYRQAHGIPLDAPKWQRGRHGAVLSEHDAA